MYERLFLVQALHLFKFMSTCGMPMYTLNVGDVSEAPRLIGNRVRD